MIRAQVVLQGGTMLPEDRFINTFHFEHDVTQYPTLAGFVTAHEPPLSNFYDTSNPGQTQAIGAYIGEFANRVGTIRWYDLNDAEPRVPVITSFTMPAPVAAVSLPEETALVLSLRASPPVTARRRGRIYLGPLALAATTTVDSSTTVPTRPAAQLMNDVCTAALMVRDAVIALPGNTHWTIRSVTPVVNGVDVAGGWVDNAFDTQRRRGPDATARTQWGS